MKKMILGMMMVMVFNSLTAKAGVLNERQYLKDHQSVELAVNSNRFDVELAYPGITGIGIIEIDSMPLDEIAVKELIANLMVTEKVSPEKILDLRPIVKWSENAVRILFVLNHQNAFLTNVTLSTLNGENLTDLLARVAPESTVMLTYKNVEI